MDIKVYNTHITLSPYYRTDDESDNSLPIIEEMYTAIGAFDQQPFPCGYMIEQNVLYVPRGTPISKLEQLTGTKAIYINDSDPSEEIFKEAEAIFKPRNHLQEESIKFLTNSGNHQLSLNLRAGFGKSYCVAAAITKLNRKAIIILPNNSLKYQWMKDTFIGMFTYQKSQLMDIAGSQVIYDFMEDNIEPRDIYFVTHATLRNYINEHGGYALGLFFKKLKVEIKVYDESHMEFANIINIDHYTNTNRTWYLTATFDRSDKTESVCFKRAFANVEDFGGIESHRMTTKHVLYHVVNINTRPSRKEMGKLLGFGGFGAAKYGKYAFFSDPKQTCYRVVELLYDKIKNIEGKTLIFTPLIESCDMVAEKLKKKFPDKRIAVYHSKSDADDKKHAFEKDVIVTTLKSCGVGKDIKDLRAVICTEPYASKNIAAQAMGRLRNRPDKKDTLYFDIVDIGIPAENWWLRARMKVISTLAKEVIYLNMEE